MADNRLAYGLAKKHGIDTEGMTPKQVWEALKKAGIDGIQRGSGAKSGSIRPGEGEPTRGFDSRKGVYNLDGEYNMPGTRKTINPGKYSKESKAYENRIKTEFGIPHVDISRIDVRCAHDVYTNLKACFSVYPALKGKIKSLVYDPELKYLGQWRYHSRQIALGRAYGSYEDVKRLYNGQVKNGNFLKGTTHSGVIAHEFAHAIDTTISKREGQFAKALVKQIYQEFSLTDDYVEKHLSAYAKEKPQEFFAIYFQEYVEKRTKASKIAKRLIKLLEENL